MNEDTLYESRTRVQFPASPQRTHDLVGFVPQVVGALFLQLQRDNLSLSAIPARPAFGSRQGLGILGGCQLRPLRRYPHKPPRETLMKNSAR